MSQESESKRRWSLWKLNLSAIGLACVAALCLYGYYALSPSYSSIREARRLYDRGLFEEALQKSQAVYDKSGESSYRVRILSNSLVEQSKKAIRWKRYAIDAQTYAQRLRPILAQKNIDTADMLIAKMILETAIADYARLDDPVLMWDRELVKEVNEYYKEFAALYQNLFKGANR
ncbi:MAG: hypothetical protein LBC09_03595 [Helicobacteraceae bacterium]|jgi:hypothetical protein|nr:hypothetical protein [Helicobacteraceae bacterium]